VTHVLVVAWLVLACAAQPLAQASTAFELPVPAGRFPVGTTRWNVTDASRQDLLAPGRARQVEVIAWYPADVAHLGVFGHSMGGVTAGQFCLGDQSCRAGLNLDGIPQYGDMIDKKMPKPFLTGLQRHEPVGRRPPRA
jgi:dienelactone hydrolase